MIVAVRSEMDSRVLIYPLLRALSNYGRICLISDNKQVNRLIDEDDDYGFRNIRVIYEGSGAIDTVYEEYGVVPEEFDFVILDNMGAIDYDVLIVPIGEIITDSFQYDIDELKKDVNTRFVQFGRAGKAAQGTKEKKKPAPKPRRGSKSDDLTEFEDDEGPEAKFKMEVSIDEEYNVSERFYGCGFPNWQDIEDLEAKHLFPKIDAKLADAIYDIFKERLAIEKRLFIKSVQGPDKEIRGHVRTTEADLESNPKRRR